MCINRNVKLSLYSDNLTFIMGDLHLEETFRAVEDELADEKLDLLFIDGDHSYDGVKKEYEMYSALVRAGGHIAFHDIIDTERYRIEG